MGGKKDGDLPWNQQNTFARGHIKSHLHGTVIEILTTKYGRKWPIKISHSVAEQALSSPSKVRASPSCPCKKLIPSKNFEQSAVLAVLAKKVLKKTKSKKKASIVPFMVAFFVHFLSIFQFHFFKKMKTKMSPEMKQKTRFSEKWPREPFFSILSFFMPFFVFIF